MIRPFTQLILFLLGVNATTGFGELIRNGKTQTNPTIETSHRPVVEASTLNGGRELPEPWYQKYWVLAAFGTGSAFITFIFFGYRERRISHQTQKLKALAERRTAELVNAADVKDHFWAGISHEILNPINGIVGIVESIKTDKLDADSRHKLDWLRQCASHLSSLVEDVLDFSKVHAPATRLESKSFDLRREINSVLAISSAESKKCGIPVESTISPDLPRELIGDPRRVRQILLNFVSNALKYSSKGTISVNAWRGPSAPGVISVVFAVSDEGSGITPVEQDKLFMHFERGTNSQTKHRPGTGLGLALCKALAEKMGGKVWMKSEPGQGSCFYFSAPFPANDVKSVSSSSCAKGVKSFRNALVVDDQEYNRIALSGLLEVLGISTTSATDHYTTLVQATDRDFDLIFLDYSMPGLNGPAIAQEIQKLPGASSQAAIVATTAHNFSDKRAECLSAGMDAFLAKPVTIERLQQVLITLSSGQPKTRSSFRSVGSDQLANLRLLAMKKHVSLAEEIALYLHEFEAELTQLAAALQSEDLNRTSYYAHMLYGRCSFIREISLEQLLRRIEGPTSKGNWENARLIATEVETQFRDLRIRLSSSSQIAPPA